MAINLTDELNAATKKGKIASAKQVYLEGNQENLQQIGDKTHQLEQSIKDISATGGASTANAVSYNNETSGMNAVNAQAAIDELAAKNKAQDNTIATKANTADVTSKMQTEQTRVNAELDKKFNKENILQETGDAEDKVMSQKAVSDKLSDLELALPFREIESPEFLKLIVDAKDHVLFGIQLDGSIEWGMGIPAPIRTKLQEIINQSKQDKTDLLAALNAAKEELSASIAELQQNKVDKEEGKTLIENEVKECFRVIENEEFIKAVVDSEGRVLFGIYRDTGKPYFPLNDMYHVEQSEEFLALWLDAENHVLFGIQRNGEIIGEMTAVKALKKVIAKIQEKVIAYDLYFKDIKNEEYIAVETDMSGKILSATKSDGSHYAYNMKSETIDAKVNKEEGKSLIDSDVAEAHSTIEDKEGRTEITTDADGKLISYRDSEGKKHEHSMEIATLDVAKINFKGNSVDNIQDALKANGFDVSHPVDWSNYLSNNGKNPLYIPEPRCARINISGIDTMPTSKTANEKAYFEMWDMQGNYFKKKVVLNAQGNSTMQFPKKSFACDFFDNDWDGDSFAIKFGDWVAQDSFHFKAQYADFFRGISIVAYKLVQEVWNSRSTIYGNPWKKALLKDIDITSGSYNNEGVAKLNLQKDTGAKCVPDAFPCVVYLNGEFYGIFNWALKKHRDNYHMDKSSATHIHLDGGYNEFLSPLNWTTFEIRNPKGLLTNVKSSKGFESYDGDHPKELLGEDTDGYDKSNKKHILSNKVKQSVIAFNKMARELNALTNENGGEEYLNKHYDIDNLIDYYVLQYVLADEDIAYNWQWVTYDGNKWFVCEYDKDRTFGQIFNCPGVRPANTMLNNIDVTNDNYPFKYLYTYHKGEIKARYTELKTLGIFTPSHLVELVKKWYDRFSSEDIKLEFEKWNESPCNRDSNIDAEHWKVRGTSYQTSTNNPYDNEKNYSIGNICSYGKGRNTIFECIKESVGNPPITKFYEHVPYDLGYHDSIWRVVKYIQERFEYVETEINKL